PLLSEIKLTTKKEDFSYARLRAQPNIPGVQLPPGAKFYTHCAAPLDISNLGSKALELEVLCGPYNIEGMTSHLKGILQFDEAGQVTNSTLTVSLSLRTFIIQFNKKKFEELRKT